MSKKRKQADVSPERAAELADFGKQISEQIRFGTRTGNEAGLVLINVIVRMALAVAMRQDTPGNRLQLTVDGLVDALADGCKDLVHRTIADPAGLAIYEHERLEMARQEGLQ